MQEETYYSDGTNWVTNQRLIFSDAQYPLGDAINAEIKAAYPPTVQAARAAIFLCDVALFIFAVFLMGKGTDPNFSTVIYLFNLIFTLAFLAVGVVSCWIAYRKRPSLLAALWNFGLWLLVAAIAIGWFSDYRTYSSLSPAWVGVMVGGSFWLFRHLNNHGIFAVHLVYKDRVAEVFSSDNRQLVEKLIACVRFALVKRLIPIKQDAKSPA